MLEHERKRMRLRDYDYSSKGAYFVTVCVQNRACLFKDASSKRMIENWILEIDKKYKNISVDYYVVMSDHIHMIIFIDEETDVNLADVMDWFKTMTTNEYIRGVRAGIYEPFEKKFWQRSYYEHIIRNEEDLLEKREYILNNPFKELEKETNA